MRRHLISEYGDLGAVKSKQKTTQYSYTVTHDILRSVDPVPEARRGREGELGTLELMFQDPSPPPPEFINNRRIYKHMRVYKHTSRPHHHLSISNHIK